MSQDIYNSHLLEKIIKTQSILAGANFDLQAFMQLVAHEIQEITPATGTVIELVEHEFMVYKAVSGTVTNFQALRLPILNSISGRCILENRVLISTDTEHDSRVNIEACRTVLARSLVVAPLICAGKPVGVIKILSKFPNAFNELHVRILELMAGFIASGLRTQILFEEKEQNIKKLKKIQEHLSYMTKHDFLTKLPNRKFFDTVLKHAVEKIKRKGGLLALMFLDIDHFKSINDTFGHAAGDKILVRFASFLKKNVRKYDFVVRLGGDEFIILLDDLQQETEGINVAKKILKKLNQYSSFKQYSPPISTSIGISFYRGETISSAQLIKQADEALYQVKTEHRNNFKIFKAN